MQIKFLKSIIEHLTNKQATAIVDLLAGKKDVNEFLIAKKLNLTINQTRNILYRISDFGLVSFIRKKDKRKGWYIYFWTLNTAKSLELLKQKLDEEIEYLNQQLNNRKEKAYYVCNNCNIEVTEEEALINDFTCSECGEVYENADNTKVIQEIEKNISKIKREEKLVLEELEKEEQKIQKRKARKIKKANEEKKAERKKRRELREKEKNKTSKKKTTKKKKTKKKVTKKSRKKSPKKKK